MQWILGTFTESLLSALHKNSEVVCKMYRGVIYPTEEWPQNQWNHDKLFIYCIALKSNGIYQNVRPFQEITKQSVRTEHTYLKRQTKTIKEQHKHKHKKKTSILVFTALKGSAAQQILGWIAIY